MAVLCAAIAAQPTLFLTALATEMGDPASTNSCLARAAVAASVVPASVLWRLRGEALPLAPALAPSVAAVVMAKLTCREQNVAPSVHSFQCQCRAGAGPTVSTL